MSVWKQFNQGSHLCLLSDLFNNKVVDSRGVWWSFGKGSVGHRCSSLPKECLGKDDLCLKWKTIENMTT